MHHLVTPAQPTQQMLIFALGNNIVFLGGFGTISVINEIFGFEQLDVGDVVVDMLECSQVASASGGVSGMESCYGFYPSDLLGWTGWTLLQVQEECSQHGLCWHAQHARVGKVPTTPSIIGLRYQHACRDNSVYGVHLGSLPPGARSYYDSIGDR
eukprot:220551-Hanusia_phi.AAC.6